MDFTCPYCKLSALWHGKPEFDAHWRACARIELGLIVGMLTMPADLVPELPEKPKGWGWSR